MSVLERSILKERVVVVVVVKLYLNTENHQLIKLN